MFLFALLTLTVHKTQLLLISEEQSSKKGVGYVIHTWCMSTKQKIVHGRGPYDINLVTDDVCRLLVMFARLSFPSITYAQQRMRQQQQQQQQQNDNNKFTSSLHTFT